MKLIELLSELKSVGDVYHFTNYDGMIGILVDNKLKAWTATYNKPYTATVSTTRDKNYLNSRIMNGKGTAITGNEVMFVLNGDLLSSNYKTDAYDDTYSVQDKMYRPSTKKWGDEAEQIWYGSKIDKDNGIANIKRYIKKIVLTQIFIENQIVMALFQPDKVIRLRLGHGSSEGPKMQIDTKLPPNDLVKNIHNLFVEYCELMTSKYGVLFEMDRTINIRKYL